VTLETIVRENFEPSPARKPPRHFRMTRRAARGNSQASISKLNQPSHI
jgi:hypothetical protein